MNPIVDEIKASYLTEEEVAEALRQTKATLRAWRARGQGPVFAKLGRTVLYPLADLRDYLSDATQEIG